MRRGTGRQLWRMMCGICKGAPTIGTDFDQVRVSETAAGGLKVQFVIGNNLLGKLDRDAQDAIAMLCAADEDKGDGRDDVRLIVESIDGRAA